MSPWGRRAASLVNRTSVGICSRDCVILKMSSVEKAGRDRTKKATAVANRINSACDTFGGTGRTGMP